MGFLSSVLVAVFLDVILLLTVGSGTRDVGAAATHSGIVLAVAYAAASGCGFDRRKSAVAAGLALSLPSFVFAAFSIPPMFSRWDGSVLLALARSLAGALAAAAFAPPPRRRTRPGSPRDFAWGLGVALILDAALLAYIAATIGESDPVFLRVGAALNSIRGIGWLFTALLPVALASAALGRRRLADGLLFGGILGVPAHLACAALAPRLWG